MPKDLPYKKGATRQQIKIIKEHFAGKSAQILVREYQDKHTAQSKLTGKTIRMSKEDADKVIYGALGMIHWGGAGHAV